MSEQEHKHKGISTNDAFSSVAFWQMMAFVALLCFVWASELLDFPAMVFNAPETRFNLWRVSLLSAAIIVAGIVATGHTYERQRKVVQRLMMACLYCHRIMREDGSWEHVAEYFLKNYPTEMERGACPECEKMLHATESRAAAAEAKGKKV